MKTLNEKQVKILSIVATIAAVCMYFAYIAQIQANLAGHKGSPIQPLAAAINCTLWGIYGLMKPQRDYPVAIANAPGVVLGLITAITALYFEYKKAAWKRIIRFQAASIIVLIFYLLLQ